MTICHGYQNSTVKKAHELKCLNVRREEKRQLHDILNIMTRSMSKSKKADVPAIYPLKGEHKKPEHVKRPPVVEKSGRNYRTRWTNWSNCF